MKVHTLAGQRVISLSAGEKHSVAVTLDTSVWSWGGKEDRDVGKGRLGHGDETLFQMLPKKIEAWALTPSSEQLPPHRD